MHNMKLSLKLYNAELLGLNKTLKPWSFLNACSMTSSKKSLTIKIKNSSDNAQIKVSLNATNKMIYGPIIKKSVKLQPKKKSVIKPLIKPILNIEKKHSNESQANACKTEANSKSLNSILEKDNIGISDNNTYSFLNIQDERLLTPVNINNIIKFPILNPTKSNDFSSNLNVSEIYNINMFEGGYQKLPSVSNILKVTMPPEQKLILDRWEKNMIKKLGEEGFKKYMQGILERGKLFHKYIELNMKKEAVKEEQLVGIEDCWKSIKEVLPKIDNIKLIESRVIHSCLQYQGCIDCMGYYKDIPAVIEFKTSTKPKLTLSSTYDNPLQLVAYIGALNYDSSYTKLSNINGALLIIAYTSGLPAHVHFLSGEECNTYWELWCQRLFQYKKMTIENKFNR